ncbi:MAG: hypothetical protein A2044_01070 [Candidatus Firestonebacteria bacterium GWA2_43_8]|nr:MAG: hypothetical protein A2044_01070 [Candidatus Firestonebacteria bacterium GWA2_43_8]
MVISSSFILFLNRENPVFRAVLLMACGLITLWILIAGSLMFFYRERVKNFITNIKAGWQLKFFLFCAGLFLIEEMITTYMTNLAPFFGVKQGEAYITASANYFDVIIFHSGVAIIPMFLCWAWILKRRDFKPFSVFILFGLTGLLAECTFGLQHLAEFALWIFVYGLMIWLPVYTLPMRDNTKKPEWWLYPVMLVFPFVFSMPFLGIVGVIMKLAGHPNFHFPKVVP